MLEVCTQNKVLLMQSLITMSSTSIKPMCNDWGEVAQTTPQFSHAIVTAVNVVATVVYGAVLAT